MKNFFSLIIILLPLYSTVAQDIPVHSGNQYVYDFLDELAGAGVIDYFQAIKPLSHQKISALLREADKERGQLSQRQKKELDRYLMAFGSSSQPSYFGIKKHGLTSGGKAYLPPVVFHYQDSLFRFTLMPVATAQVWSGGKELVFHRRSGLMALASIGTSWGIWASLEDNHESLPLAEDQYLTQRMGGNYKRVGEGVDYSETRGGISYAWDWGSLALVKDHATWGSGYQGSMIFSGRTPSFTMLKLHLSPVKWLEFNYFHGWLISEVLDSNRTAWYTNAYGTDRREYYHGKYVAANMFTFKPWPKLHFSFGNSIVYNESQPKAVYFIPFLFYKSVDHTLSGAGSNRVGQNAQMYLDISSWQLPKIHAYASVFVDEISFNRMFKPAEQSNFIGLKAGLAWYGAPIRNSRIIAEYSRSNPLVYRHYSPMTTFESNRYNLGYYLGDNAEEMYLGIRWMPVSGMMTEVSWANARKGNDYTSLGTGRAGLPFMETERWKSRVIKWSSSYRILHHINFFASVSHETYTGEALSIYTPDVFQGEHVIVNAGFIWNH